ncbi:macrolide ABC transporter ATP-binding protein [bacterium (Candidatus Howlettbacteria) CG_4_10_14_0_8_um_filter_40_9]|nr:MAG: macrolide ABC transporter ATP-binding protein [bacterium (Candidatus Howlettbacteria) CG_4_10_14_0_8_um_filter_40_9]
MDIIALKKITKKYQTGEEETSALRGIDLTLKKGDFVAIMGPSGSGKSTLMHILGLLDRPSNGSYLLGGEDVSKLGKTKQAAIRNKQIGFVFLQFNLLPRTTVLDNVVLPTIYSKVKVTEKRAREIIKEVGLIDRIKYKSNQLSGGQIQRVAIARALVMDPSIILADEPTGNLDSKNSKEIMDIFKRINQKGATIILITHEEEIAKYAHRIIRLKDGQII